MMNVHRNLGLGEAWRNVEIHQTLQPGYLKDVLPSQAPQDGQAFEVIMQDVKDQIMPGLSHRFSFLHYCQSIILNTSHQARVSKQVLERLQHASCQSNAE